MLSTKRFLQKKLVTPSSATASLSTGFKKSMCNFLVKEHRRFKVSNGTGKSAAAVWQKPYPPLPQWYNECDGNVQSFKNALTEEVSGTFDRSRPEHYDVKPNDHDFLQLSDMIDSARTISVDLEKGSNWFQHDVDLLRTPEEQLAWRVAAAALPVDSVQDLYNRLAASVPFPPSVTRPQEELVYYLAHALRTGDTVSFRHVMHLASSPMHPVKPGKTAEPRWAFLHITGADCYLRSLQRDGRFPNADDAVNVYREFLLTAVEEKETMSWNNLVVIPIFSGLTDKTIWSKMPSKGSYAAKAMKQYFHAQAATPQQKLFEERFSRASLLMAIDDMMRSDDLPVLTSSAQRSPQASPARSSGRQRRAPRQEKSISPAKAITGKGRVSGTASDAASPRRTLSGSASSFSDLEFIVVPKKEQLGRNSGNLFSALDFIGIPKSIKTKKISTPNKIVQETSSSSPRRSPPRAHHNSPKAAVPALFAAIDNIMKERSAKRLVAEATR